MKTITIIGGGPSVADIDWSPEKFPNVIAVNNAWQIAPWAAILFFGDKRWWDKWGNRERVLKGFNNRIITCLLDYKDDPRLAYRELSGKKADLDDPTKVLAPDSGSKAICLAYHEGAKRIELAGFDVGLDEAGRSHFHDDHKEPSNPSNYKTFADSHRWLHGALAERGVEVVRITKPGVQEIPYAPR